MPVQHDTKQRVHAFPPLFLWLILSLSLNYLHVLSLDFYIFLTVFEAKASQFLISVEIWAWKLTEMVQIKELYPFIWIYLCKFVWFLVFNIWWSFLVWNIIYPIAPWTLSMPILFNIFLYSCLLFSFFILKRKIETGSFFGL